MTTHALTTLSSSAATRLTPLGVHSGMDNNHYTKLAE